MAVQRKVADSGELAVRAFDKSAKRLRNDFVLRHEGRKKSPLIMLAAAITTRCPSGNEKYGFRVSLRERDGKTKMYAPLLGGVNLVSCDFYL